MLIIYDLIEIPVHKCFAALINQSPYTAYYLYAF